MTFTFGDGSFFQFLFFFFAVKVEYVKEAIIHLAATVYRGRSTVFEDSMIYVYNVSKQ